MLADITNNGKTSPSTTNFMGVWLKALTWTIYLSCRRMELMLAVLSLCSQVYPECVLEYNFHPLWICCRRSERPHPIRGLTIVLSPDIPNAPYFSHPQNQGWNSHRILKYSRRCFHTWRVSKFYVTPVCPYTLPSPENHLSRTMW